MDNLDLKKRELILYWRSAFNFSEDVFLAFVKVPRENFISPELRDLAYNDAPLPTSEHQTISQPTTVMMMLNFLDIRKDSKILEIGCGSGYNAALISVIAEKGRIVTCEIVESLAEKAKKNLVDYKNVEVIYGDGAQIAGEKGPFDRIIFTAAIPKVPEELFGLLNDGGIILAPVGELYLQEMTRVKKIGVKAGEGFTTEELGEFVFVPMRGEWGFK
ncbi:protein-L-isoaspartate O-methyltransferase [bacterium]|nr:protein-L-isoaspartate O-methyltransferase [bacterium]